MTLQLIEINLSEELGRKKKGKPASATSAAPGQQVKLPPSFGIAVAVIVIALAGFYLYVNTKQRKVKSINNRITELGTKHEKYVKLMDEEGKMNERDKALEAWKKSRVSYMYLWNRIAKIVPDSIYLTDIRMMNVDPMAEQIEMALVGMANGAAGETVIVEFVRKIKGDRLFTNIFNKIELSPVIGTKGSDKVFTIQMSRGIVTAAAAAGAKK